MLVPLGFLGREVLAARGLAFPVRRALVGGNIAEALLHGEFLDFGGVLVHDGGFVMATPVTLVSLEVALMRKLGALGGTLDVLLGDGFPRGELLLPAQQLIGALGGFVTR